MSLKEISFPSANGRDTIDGFFRLDRLFPPGYQLFSFGTILRPRESSAPSSGTTRDQRIKKPGTILTPKMSEILWEESMEPMGVSAYKLAQAIHVPSSRIQDILHDRRKITADTSLRLAKYFGVSDRYFLDMRNDIDIRELKARMSKEISDM